MMDFLLVGSTIFVVMSMYVELGKSFYFRLQ